jgi:hypothetical protein
VNADGGRVAVGVTNSVVAPFERLEIMFKSRPGVRGRKKKKNPCKEGRMEDIGAHVGYTVLFDRVSKVIEAGVQMCYYPAAPPC